MTTTKKATKINKTCEEEEEEENKYGPWLKKQPQKQHIYIHCNQV